MKISRQKRLRRVLNFFRNNYNFRSPFQILIDATFCQEALKSKVNLREQIPKYLEDPEVKLFTTACVITEAEALGPEIFGGMLIVKQFKAQKCGHEKEPICADDCLLSMVENGNLNHYIIATQDPRLSEKCREMLGVPILYLRHNAINLEKPSKMNTETVDMKMQEKLKGPDYQHEIIKKMKLEVFGEQEVPQKKRKKVKGPNPLSCKKKRVKPSEPQIEKVRKRKRHKRQSNKSVDCREMLGVPILYLRHNAINLEKPSKMNTETVDMKMQEKLKGPDYQHEIIKKMKLEVFGEQEVPQKKRKKVKGPNPLSCKKKRVKPSEPQIEKVRKRKRHKRQSNKSVDVSQ